MFLFKGIAALAVALSATFSLMASAMTPADAEAQAKLVLRMNNQTQQMEYLSPRGHWHKMKQVGRDNMVEVQNQNNADSGWYDNNYYYGDYYNYWNYDRNSYYFYTPWFSLYYGNYSYSPYYNYNNGYYSYWYFNW